MTLPCDQPSFPAYLTQAPSERETKVQWACLAPSCIGVFTHKAGLERHVRTVHILDLPRYDCPKSRCSRKGEYAFTREDHLKEHLRNYHREKLPKRGGGGSNNSEEK